MAFNDNIIEKTYDRLASAIKALPKKCRICIEGDIATGKSVLCADLEKLLKEHGKYVIVISESIDKELLKAFNENPEKYGLVFQQSMMQRRMRALADAHRLIDDYRSPRSYLTASLGGGGDKNSIDADEGIVVILDTGPLRELAFSEANYLMGHMTSTAYEDHVSTFVNDINGFSEFKPEYIVLLNLPAAHSLEYIQKRARPGEDKLDLLYLETIQKCHLSNISGKVSSNIQTVALNNNNHPMHGSKRFVFTSDSFVDAKDVLIRVSISKPDYEE